MGEGRVEAERLVRPGLVVEAAIELAGGVELEDVGDLEAVQVLVLEGLVEALDDAVRLGRVMTGPDVVELDPVGDEAGEAEAL